MKKLILLLILLCIHISYSQTYQTQNYTEEDGLPSSDVYSVVKDKSGKIWFSTENGVRSYDGFLWEAYNSDIIFYDNKLVRLLIDNESNLWAYCQNKKSIDVFAFNNGRWAFYTKLSVPNPKLRLSSFEIKVTENSYEILVGTRSHGLYYYVDEYWSQIVDPKIGNSIHSVKSYDDSFYICSNNGVFSLSYGKINYSLNKQFNTTDQKVFGLIKDKTNYYILGENFILEYTPAGSKKIFKFANQIYWNSINKFEKINENLFLFISNRSVKLANIKRKSLINLNLSDGVLSNYCKGFYLDDENNIWISSYYGVSKITSLRFESYKADKNKFMQDVTAMVELDNNKIAFASDSKLFILNQNTHEIKEIVKEIGENKVQVLDLARTSDNKLLIAGKEYGLGFWEEGKKVKWYKVVHPVTRIAVDKSDNIHLASWNEYYEFKNKKAKLIKIPNLVDIRNLILSPEEEIYFATGKDGIFKINTDKSVTNFVSKTNNTYNNTYNLSFYNNDILVGSKAGLLKIEGDSLVPFFNDDKLKNRPIYFIQKDLSNKLWFGTNYGVYSWDNKTLKNYSKKEGLLGLETFRSSYLICKEGDFWIGTDRGLSKYQEDYDFEIKKPIVLIDSIIINDLVTFDKNDLELNHTYNDLELYFRSSSFINEKENTFKVFLEGYDNEWSNELPITQHIIRYLNIPPGDYRIHILVKNSNGVWSNEYISSEIKILSPFYTSWKFILIIVIVVGMVLVLITRYVINFRYTANLEDEIIKRTKELDESQKRYFQMFDDNKAIMITIDPTDGKVLNANKSAISYYKYSLEQFQQLNFKAIDYLYQNEYHPNFQDAGYSNQNHYETQHKIATGELKEVELYFSFINVEGKNIIYAIVHDIAAKKTAEKNLIESEEKYRALINNMQDGVFVLKDLKFSFVNAAFAIMVGYRSKELIGITPKRLIAKDDFKKVFKKYILISSGEKISEEHEFRLIHRASGNFVYVNATFSVINYQGSYALLGTIKNITIRKKQEEQLRKLSTAVEQSPTGIIITNLDGNIEYVNPRFSEITGFGIHETIRKKPSILKSGLMSNEIYENLWKTVKAGNIWRGELCNKKKNGDLYWISCAIAPIKNESGVLSHFIAVQTDITFQKFAQEKIETQQQQLSSILNNMPLILFAVNKENKFTFVRGKGLNLFNINSSELIGRSVSITFKQSPELIIDLQNTVKNKKQSRIIRQIGEYYFEIHLIPIFNSDDEYNGINGIAYDITKRFKTQKALKESEERFRSLYENSSVGIYRSTKNGYILMANPSLVKMLGYESQSELSKHNLEDENFNVKFDRSEFVNRLETKGVVKGLETIWIRKDGQVLYVRESARKITTVEGHTLYYDGVIEDITDMKLAEQELVKSEARNRAMLHAIPDIMFEITLDGEILAAHLKDSDAEILQLPQILIGENIFDHINSFLAEKTKLSILKVIENKSIEVFEFTVKNNGKVNYFESRFIIAGASSVIVMLRDITDRKEGEKMLIRAKNEAEKSDKLKSEFLAQMSHEIRTPINSILSFTSLIKEEMFDKVEDDLKLCFDVIDNGGHRLIRTIDSILNMSQLQSGTYQPIFSDVNIDKDILKTAVAELKQRAGEKNLELNYNKKSDELDVRVDNYTVGQIFINLIDNAIKYTEQGSVSVTVDRNENHKLFVAVEDTGIGMSDEYIPNLFKPFTQEESGYTRRYEGNGLGLALVKNYVDINNADIQVESKKGIGTKFKVTFNN